MAKIKAQHPLIYSYLKKYQEDPSSRVFAPLAEAYRKAGMIDEAIEIAKEGLILHPHFIGGRVALARALFDKRLYSEVVDELSSVVLNAPDNLVAQRLLGDACLLLGRVAESLNAYKMLLYFSPQDRETMQIVQEMESQAYEKGTLILTNDPVPLPQFDEKTARSAIESDPGLRRDKKIKRIEMLQALLQKVERYRIRREINASNPRLR